MRIYLPVAVVLVSLLVYTIGCGSKNVVKKGDTFEVLIELTEVADIQSNDAYADEFTCTIPKGALLEALNNSASGFFECRPVSVQGKSGDDFILNTFVPEYVRNKESFKNFTITLSIEYIGSKVKKVKK